MKVAVGLLVAAFAAVAGGVALAFAGGGLSPFAAWAALALGAALGALAARGTPGGGLERPGLVEWLLLGAFALACFRAFFWLLFPRGGEWLVLSPNNLGDLSLHLNFIRHLAGGTPFWPESPILTGEPLKYPLGADFLNALLLRAGLPVEPGLVWVGLAGSVLTGIALWRWGRGFAVAAFLFGGGLAGFAWLAAAIRSGDFTPQDVQGAGTWKNLFLTLFVTQRGLLLALPAGLLLLADWRARWLRGEAGVLPAWAGWLLYATMPLHNVHAFLYLSVALAFALLFAAPGARRGCFVYGALAVVPATLAMALVTGGFAAGGSIHVLPGWLQDAETGVPWWWFWPRNFGFYPALAALLLLLAIIRPSRERLGVVGPAVVVFVACVFVSFAVWPWDNTKLLLWCWLAVAPGIWATLIAPLPAVGRVVVCFALFFTGAVSLVAGLDGRHGYRLADIAEVRAVESALRPLPLNARFAAAPEYAHPLLLLGRKVALGYDGHLWSHGLDYQGKMARLAALMEGEPDWPDVVEELDVDYLFWGAREEERYPVTTQIWQRILPVVARTDAFTIYRLR